MIAVFSEIHTKHTNTLCGQNIEFLYFKPGGAYSDHCAVKGLFISEIENNMSHHLRIFKLRLWEIRCSTFEGCYFFHLQGSIDESLKMDKNVWNPTPNNAATRPKRKVSKIVCLLRNTNSEALLIQCFCSFLYPDIFLSKFY